MVVPFAAGGATDIVGRLLSPRLSELLGQQIIIENVGGAGGATGTARVAKALPDGYQLVLGNVGTHAHNQTLYKKLPYDAVRDFAPVALIADLSIVLLTRKDFPADNLPEFIAYAKANLAKLQYGSAGAGSSTHLACVLLNAAVGINITHIPYRGGAPAMQDLLAGRIDYQCPTTSTAAVQIQGKTAKGLAALTRNRTALLPDLPTAHEQGLTDFEAGFWTALFLPRNTPAAIIGKLHDATVAAIDTPAVRERMKENGVDVVAPERRSPEYLAKFVASEINKWAGPIKASGVSMD
jgi:tripartite-type tricarboxylate transporter receptor subunit TctC